MLRQKVCLYKKRRGINSLLIFYKIIIFLKQLTIQYINFRDRWSNRIIICFHCYSKIYISSKTTSYASFMLRILKLFKIFNEMYSFNTFRQFFTQMSVRWSTNLGSRTVSLYPLQMSRDTFIMLYLKFQVYIEVQIYLLQKTN